MTVIYVIFICAVKRTYFPVGLTLFIDCNLQSETLLTPRCDVACDVMSILSVSDSHLRKLATLRSAFLIVSRSFCNERRTTLYYCITLYFRGKKFSRKVNLKYFREKIFSRICYSRENIFPRKYLPAKITSRENIFSRKYLPAKISSCEFFSVPQMLIM